MLRRPAGSRSAGFGVLAMFAGAMLMGGLLLHLRVLASAATMSPTSRAGPVLPVRFFCIWLTAWRFYLLYVIQIHHTFLLYFLHTTYRLDPS